jgi:hypothetical protein
MDHHTRIIRNRSGQSIVEFVICLPVFVLIIVGVLQIGNLFIARERTILEARRVNSLLSGYTEYAHSRFWDMWSDIAIGKTPLYYFTKRIKEKSVEKRTATKMADNLRYRLIYVPFEESLSPGEIVKLKQIAQRYPKAYFTGALSSLGYMEPGYERMTVTASIDPLPIVRTFHPQPYRVEGWCSLNLSEGLERRYEEAFE